MLFSAVACCSQVGLDVMRACACEMTMSTHHLEHSGLPVEEVEVITEVEGVMIACGHESQCIQMMSMPMAGRARRDAATKIRGCRASG